MKTLLKITRSIITSFLFIILSTLLIFQFLFTFIRVHNIKLSEIINREAALNIILEDKIIHENELAKKLAINYIDDYINYVFYKRSYPSISITDLNITSEEEKRMINQSLEKLRDKLDIEYKTVLQIREINNFISNSSIYLILNVLLFTTILIIIIVKFDILNSIKLLGLNLILISITLLIGGCLFYTNLINNNEFIIKLFFKEILNDRHITYYFNQVLIYMVIGFILLISSLLRTKLKRK